ESPAPLVIARSVATKQSPAAGAPDCLACPRALDPRVTTPLAMTSYVPGQHENALADLPAHRKRQHAAVRPDGRSDIRVTVSQIESMRRLRADQCARGRAKLRRVAFHGAQQTFADAAKARP